MTAATLPEPETSEPAAGLLAAGVLAGEALGERDLARLLAAQMGLPFLDLETAAVDRDVAALLPFEDARLYAALPVQAADGAVVLAVARPTNEPAIREVARKLARPVELAVTSRTDLMRAIERLEHPEPEPQAPVTRARRRVRPGRRALAVLGTLAAVPLTVLAGDLTARLLEDSPAPRPAAPSASPATFVPATAARVWVARPLPPGGRPPFAAAVARELLAAAERRRLDWALLAAVVPSGGEGPRTLARRLVHRGARRDPWSALLAVTGRTGLADRGLALARAYRVLGSATLTEGVATRKTRLSDDVLADRRIVLARSARADVAAGVVDARVLALLRFLAETRGQVAVARLVSGDGPEHEQGAWAAHGAGTAVDVTAVGGAPVADAETAQRTVRDVLLLPEDLRPHFVVALPGIARRAFPVDADADRLHLGY